MQQRSAASAAPAPAAAPVARDPNPDRVEALDKLDLNVTDGLAGTFAQDLLQHMVRKDAIHKKYKAGAQEGGQ